MGEPAAKKLKTDPVWEKCGGVATALTEVAHLPKSVRQMLAGLVPETLGVPKGDRHAYQQQMVDLMGEALRDHKAAIQKRIADLEIRVNGVDEEMAAAEAEFGMSPAEVTQEVEDLVDACDAAKDELRDFLEGPLATFDELTEHKGSPGLDKVASAKGCSEVSTPSTECSDS